DEAGGQLGFGKESLPVAGLRQECRVHELDRHRAAESALLPAVDFSHASAPELVAELVATAEFGVAQYLISEGHPGTCRGAVGIEDAWRRAVYPAGQDAVQSRRVDNCLTTGVTPPP